MKLVYNPGNDSVVYGTDGQMVAPGEWAYLEDDRTVRKAIEESRLIEKEIPQTMPEGDINPKAYAALKAAVDDQPKVETAPETVAGDPPQTEQSTPVRNTGNRRTTNKNREA